MKISDTCAVLVTKTRRCDDGDSELTVSPEIEYPYPIYLYKNDPCPRVNSIIVVRKTKVKKLERCWYYKVVVRT